MDYDPTQGEKRFFGKYRGQVADRNDPLKMKRVKCFVPEIFGNEIFSDWATIMTPVGGIYDYGLVAIPPLNAGVWVEFEAGDVNRPIVTGYWYSMPDGESEVPKHARGLPDETDETKGSVEGETIPFLPPPEEGQEPAERGEPLEIQEPPSPFSGKYPDVIVFKSLSGHMMEMDDTDGEERIHIFHRKGSYREIRRDGSVVDKTVSSSREIVAEDKILHVLGKEYRLIEQPADLTYRSDKKMVVAGTLKEEIMVGKILVVNGRERKEVKGESYRTFGGPLIERVAGKHALSTGGSEDTTVGAARSCTISQIDSEVIGNQMFDTLAKSLKVLFGNYQVELTAGDQKFKLTLGEFLTEVIAPGTSGYAWRVKATAGNAEMNLTAGNFDVKVTAGNISEETQAGTWTAKSSLIATLESLIQAVIKAPIIKVGDATATNVSIAGGMVEALVLGTAFTTLFNSHIHPVPGVVLGGPGTVSSPPLPLVMIPGVHTSVKAFTA
jgi:hypothetical protein